MRTLVLESFSPWCERSRFVLLHHGLAFEEREHVPLVGELMLQLRARKIGQRVSVPLLIDGDSIVRDSLAIAEHVDRLGERAKLIPESHRASIHELHAALEPLLATGRANAIHGVLTDDEIALASTPRALRSLPGSKSAARMGARFLAKKYGVSFDGIADRLRAGFERVRRTIDGRDYVHGSLSYADVLCASSLQFLMPVSERFVSLEPATRRSFSHPQLANDFRDLIEWRDALYEKHRPIASAA